MQHHLLLCAPTSQPSMSGAQERWCHLCGASVWVSRSMLSHVDGGGALPACPDCAPGLIPQAATAIIHPDQVAELHRSGLLDTARRYVQAANFVTGQRRAPFK